MTKPIPRAHIHGCCDGECKHPEACENCFCRGCYRSKCKQAPTSIFLDNSVNRMPEEQIWFHGTSSENVLSILEEGFHEGTWFARHLEDALGFGGEFVFFVNVKFRSRKWQVLCANAIPKTAIKRVIKYNREIIWSGR